MSELFAGISGQDQVTSYLQRVHDTGSMTHAYLVAGGEEGTGADIALRFAAEVLPTLLAAATAYFAIGLLDTMEDGAFTQESAAYAPKLAEWCVKVLKLSVLFALAVNVLQAVCAPLILSTSISIPLPVLELCFVLAALLGARLIASNVALAADNDLFI